MGGSPDRTTSVSLQTVTSQTQESHNVKGMRQGEYHLVQLTKLTEFSSDDSTVYIRVE